MELDFQFLHLRKYKRLTQHCYKAGNDLPFQEIFFGTGAVLCVILQQFIYQSSLFIAAQSGTGQ